MDRVLFQFSGISQGLVDIHEHQPHRTVGNVGIADPGCQYPVLAPFGPQRAVTLSCLSMSPACAVEKK